MGKRIAINTQRKLDEAINRPDLLGISSTALLERRRDTDCLQNSDPSHWGIVLYTFLCANPEASDDGQKPGEHSHLQSKTSNQYVRPNFRLIALPLASSCNACPGNLDKKEEGVEPNKCSSDQVCWYKENMVMGRWNYGAD